MKPRSIITHGVALATGVGLALGVAAYDRARSSVVKDVPIPARTPHPAPPMTSAQPSSPGTVAPARGKFLLPREYREAWEAIARRSVPPDQRMELQGKLLAQWAQVDLRGAMRATLENKWPASSRRMGESTGSELNEAAFREAFVLAPEDAWAALQEPEFRFSAEFFHADYAFAMASSRQAMERMLPRLPVRMCHDIVTAIASPTPPPNPEERQATLRVLGAVPDEARAKELVRQFVLSTKPLEPLEVLEKRLADATAPALRMMAEQEYLAALAGRKDLSVTERWQKLPAGLEGSTADTFFIRALQSDNVPEVVELALQAGAWDFLKNGSWLQPLEEWAATAGTLDQVAAKQLAAKIPARPEAETLYRKLVTRFGEGNSENLRQWIGEMPAGWHRDRALAAYAGFFESYNANAGWARDQIVDPEVRKRLEEK